jgi:hypothetical protein
MVTFVAIVCQGHLSLTAQFHTVLSVLYLHGIDKAGCLEAAGFPFQ